MGPSGKPPPGANPGPSFLTWMRLLPQSATMMFPLESTATPVGALNCPLPSPWEPNLKRNSPSALYTWQGKGLGTGDPASGRRRGLGGGWGEAPGLRTPRSAAINQFFFPGFTSTHATAYWTPPADVPWAAYLPWESSSSFSFPVTGNTQVAMSHSRFHLLLRLTANELPQPADCIANLYPMHILPLQWSSARLL